MAINNLKTFKISTLLNGNNGKLSIKNGIITQMPVSPDVDLVNVAYMPIIRNKDNAKQLPNYTMALQRVADDYLPAEDLDNIQLELETLLSSVALRSRVLKSEIESLDKDERRNERRLKQISNVDKQPGSPMSTIGVSSSLLKRKRDEITLVRKPKNVVNNSVLKQSKHAKKSPSVLLTEDSLDCTPTMTTHNNSLHHQHHHHHHHQLPGRDNHQHQHHHHHHHHHIQKLSVPKNDTPNKFWLSVEPYCMPITNEDLRMLDDLIDQYSGPLIPPIPELGSHYSISWANESLKEIQQISNVNSNFNRMKHQNNELLKKADGLLGKGATGQLTQRLVSALVEEQLIQNPMEIAAAAITETSNSSSENTHSTQLNFRSLAMFRNCIDIEKRVKKELLEQGILDVNDFPNDDEIHGEIKRLTTELSSIAEYNSAALKRLQDAAKQEIKRLEIKRKLDIVDQEILETFKRTMANKAKRRPLTAEEQQDIFRLTAEQKSLSDQLERISANYLYD